MTENVLMPYTTEPPSEFIITTILEGWTQFCRYRNSSLKSLVVYWSTGPKNRIIAGLLASAFPTIYFRLLISISVFFLKNSRLKFQRLNQVVISGSTLGTSFVNIAASSTGRTTFSLLSVLCSLSISEKFVKGGATRYTGVYFL